MHALLCGYSSSLPLECNLFPASTTYYFANANDGTAGGASFTTDARGYGPNDSNAWSGLTYFNTTATYWGNYGVTGSDATYWYYDIGGDCSAWSSNSSSATAETGTSSATTAVRWSQNGSVACNTAEHIICYVNP